jgi:peptidyl-prolyl cis-trans isomerase B (cyclophilin B)
LRPRARLASSLALALRLGLAACALAALLSGCGGSSRKSAGTGKGNGGVEIPALDSNHSYDAIVETSEGTFTIELATKEAPKTTASFVSLARKGFFDGTIFHRIVPGFVIQGGDPTGTGTGGPGYTTVEPPPRSLRYTRGVVAMAKTATAPAGSAGSQFFVVTAADAGLRPEYALLGRVSAGEDVVEAIGKLGDASQRPTKRVEIESVQIEEGPAG